MQGSTTVAEPIVVNLTPPEIKVAAGAEPVEITAVVRNASPTVDQYRVEIENLDPSWYTLTVDSVALFPGDSASIPIRLHPPKNSQTRAGHYTFIVRARSNADPSLVGVTKGVVQIGSYANFQLELSPKRFTGRRGNFKLNVANGGNSDVQLALTGRDAESKLSYGFRPKEPTIAPNTKKSVPFTIRTKGLRLVGKEERHQFVVTAQPTDGTEKDAKETQGEYVHRPWFSSLRAPLMLAAFLFLLVAWFTFKPDLNPCSARFLLPPNIQFYSSFACTGGFLKPFAPSTAPSIEGQCQSGAGFSEVRTKYSDLIGGCVESEWYDELGNAHQKTEKGQLLYLQKGADAQIYFFRNDNTIHSFVNCNPPGTFNDCETILVEKKATQ